MWKERNLKVTMLIFDLKIEKYDILLEVILLWEEGIWSDHEDALLKISLFDTAPQVSA